MRIRIDKYWSEQQPIFDRLYQLGTNEYVKTLPAGRQASHLEWAFTDPDRTIRCIDERTPGGLHLAGSGILLPEDEIEQVVKRLTKAKVDGVWSHAECGAAALAAKKQNLPAEQGDVLGKTWAKTFSDKLGVPYYGHIEPQEFSGPSGFHIARTTYYIGAPSFNPTRVEGLPPGFVINRGYLSEDYAKMEADLSVKIATGNHGFGDRIDQSHPFLLIAVADPNNPTLPSEKLRKELSEVAQHFQGRVRVDGFTPPQP